MEDDLVAVNRAIHDFLVPLASGEIIGVQHPSLGNQAVHGWKPRRIDPFHYANIDAVRASLEVPPGGIKDDVIIFE